jgi:hypothetical protein
VSKRLDKAIREMDATSWDADGRQRLSSYSRADYAFLSSLLDGWVGSAIVVACVAALVALIVWLYA